MGFNIEKLKEIAVPRSKEAIQSARERKLKRLMKKCINMNKQQKQAFDALRKKMDEAGISSLDTLFNATTKEEIARSAANNWCRCFKCDKIIRDTNLPCDKEKLLTCHQWYDGYRTALLALGDERIKEL